MWAGIVASIPHLLAILKAEKAYQGRGIVWLYIDGSLVCFFSFMLAKLCAVNMQCAVSIKGSKSSLRVGK